MELRAYQQQALDNIVNDLQTVNKTVCILPTGAGKTLIISKLCQHYAQNGVVLYLSHLSALTEQTKKVVGSLTTNLKIGVMQAEHYPYSDVNIIIGTRQTVSKVNNLAPFKDKINAVIIDEVHGFLTKQYQDILKYLPNAKLCGMTATPYKCSKLITHFFDKVSFSKSLQDIITEGYLVQPILKLIDSSSGVTLEERIAKVAFIQKTQEKGKSAVIFMRRIEECKLVRNILKSQGITSCIVTSRISKEKRPVLLEEFKNGIHEVLITCNVVSEGFDAPRLEVIYMPYPVQSPTLYIQRMGRALRLYEGKESCRIYALGGAPEIKKGFLSALTMGKKRVATVLEEKEMLELEGETHTEVYDWTKQICVIAQKIKELGKINLYELLINKKFPIRYLKNQDLILKGMDSTIEDNIEAFEKSCMRKFGKEDHFNVTEGIMRGRHVKDLPWGYKRLAWVREWGAWKYDTDTYKKIREYYKLKRAS